MNIDQQSTSVDDIMVEACAWTAQLETGDMSAADVAAFREWIQRSPAHAAEINRLARLSERINILSELADPIEEASKRYSPIVKRQQHQVPSWMGFGAIAATIMVMVTFFLLPDGPSNAPMEFRTAIGGYLEQSLDDGSTMQLNTNTRITVHYDKVGRHVSLHRGEAFFEVARDVDRPFVVTTERGEIRAIGTAFAVRLKDSGLSVTVTKGSVAIEKGERLHQTSVADLDDPAQIEPTVLPDHQSIVLEAGQSYDETTADTINTIPDSDIQRQLAWQGGLFEFSDIRLEEVVEEVGRYTSQRIIIEDPELRALKFDGIFRTHDTGPLFEALQDYFGVKVTWLDKDTVTLTRNRDQKFD